MNGWGILAVAMIGIPILVFVVALGEDAFYALGATALVVVFAITLTFVLLKAGWLT